MPDLSILSGARKLYGRLVRSKSREQKPYRPDFAAPPLPDGEVGNAASAGPQSEAARAALAFRARQSPRFFIADDRLAAIGRTPGAVPGAGATGPHESGPYATDFTRSDTGPDWRDTAPGPGNDTLYPARPHRFAFAPKLALAELCGAGGGDRLAAIIASWQEFAQAGRSRLPYLSTLVVTQRFLALSWAWAFLAARPDATVRDGFALEYEILRTLWADARFLLPRLGNAFPNNHLLADGFIGWYVATLFPEFVPDPETGPTSERLWLRELERQTYTDGTSLEHCMHYHEFACEMAAAYLLLSRRNERPVPEWVEERTRRMLDFQTAIGGPGGRPLCLGDATDDPLFALEPEESWATGAMRELHRALFDAAIPPAPPDAPGVATAFWQLGGALAPVPDTPRPEPPHSAFDDGGYHVFHDGVLGARLVFRTGPGVGTDVLGGHMHADFNSVTLSLGGTPLIVDAGTYTYRDAAGWPPDSPPWRTYFMGARAHNGLAIGAADPLGPPEGSFRPQAIAARVDTAHRSDPRVAVRVDGMMRDAGAYTGWRRGVVHVPGHYWLVHDSVPDGRDAGDASFGFQFAADAAVAPVASAGNVAGIVAGIVADLVGGAVLIAHDRTLADPDIASGNRDPVAGWVSTRYGQREPAPQARYACPPAKDGSSTASAFLVMPVRNRDDAHGIEVRAESDSAFQVTTGDGIDYLILPPVAGAAADASRETSEAWGIRFSGDLMWLRVVDGRPVALRCLGLTGLSAPAHGLDITAPEPVAALAITFGAGGPAIDYSTDNAVEISFGPGFG